MTTITSIIGLFVQSLISNLSYTFLSTQLSCRTFFTLFSPLFKIFSSIFNWCLKCFSFAKTYFYSFISEISCEQLQSALFTILCKILNIISFIDLFNIVVLTRTLISLFMTFQTFHTVIV